MNLLQSQIHENCKLSLPEGLKDLMSDISREVLRAQPQNVYQFIANYLEALLEVREAVSIAHHICEETCKCTCETELHNELKEIELDEEDVAKAAEVIQKHLKSGAVNESSLFMKLVKKTSIDEFYIPAVQEAIQKAFKREQLKNTKTKYQHNINNDETTKAVQHTMHVYETSKLKTEELFISTHLKPCVKIYSPTCFAEYQGVHEFKNTTCDFEEPPDISNEQSLKLDSTANNVDEELETNKDTLDINTQISDEQNLENDVFGNDDETDHPELIDDDSTEVINDDDICEEIENGESGNDSIVSSLKESLANSDNSDDEVF